MPASVPATVPFTPSVAISTVPLISFFCRNSVNIICNSSKFTNSQYLYLYFTICSVDTFSFEIRYVLRRIRGHQNGAPEEIRTPDPRFRKPLLYPTELQAHWSG